MKGLTVDEYYSEQAGTISSLLMRRTCRYKRLPSAIVSSLLSQRSRVVLVPAETVYLSRPSYMVFREGSNVRSAISHLQRLRGLLKGTEFRNGLAGELDVGVQRYLPQTEWNKCSTSLGWAPQMESIFE